MKKQTIRPGALTKSERLEYLEYLLLKMRLLRWLVPYPLRIYGGFCSMVDSWLGHLDFKQVQILMYILQRAAGRVQPGAENIISGYWFKPGHYGIRIKAVKQAIGLVSGSVENLDSIDWDEIALRRYKLFQRT